MIRTIRLCLIATLLLAFAAPTMGQDRIPWITELGQARQLAQQQQRLVLLHFWSEECPPCRLLEQNVFNQPELVRVMSTSFIPVKINALQQSKIADFYRIDRVPTDILVLPNGKEIYRTTSPSNANAYIAMLDQVRAKAMMEPGRTSEIANTSPPATESSLPPMANGDGNDEPTSAAINSDPRAGLGDATAQPERSRNSWKPDTTANAEVPQPVVVQNRFTQNQSVASPGNHVPAQEASGGPRYDNPYVTGAPNATTTTAPAADPSVTNSATAPSVPAADATRGGNFVPSRSNNVDAATSDISSTPVPTKSPWQGTGQAPGQPAAAPGGPPTDPKGAASPPTEVPPISLDGHCPVTLLTTWKWTKGDPRWGAVHRGRTYLMTSQAARDQFLSDPDRYSPALSGFDPVRFAESRQLVNGKREHGVWCNKTIYLFADEESLIKFQQQPDRFVAAVRQAMTAGRPSTPQR